MSGICLQFVWSHVQRPHVLTSKMLCKVCGQIESKYKCSTCYCPYCSLNCWKVHKNEEKCEASEMKAEDCTQVETKTTKYFTEDTIDPERLSKLGESNKIKNLLKNKYLRSTLSAVENATNPENAVFEAMKNPDFVKFVDECLQIVEDLDVS